MREHGPAVFASRVVDRALRPLSKVRPGEGVSAVLLLVAVFLLLSSYYMLKTAREGMILAGGGFGLGGDELKTYATGVMALLLFGLVPAYDALANRVRRLALIDLTYGFVLVCLGVFYVLGHAGVPIGLAFFIWLGIVSLFLIAQFWSYANDLYTEEQGKRLFAIIAVGGSVGAMLGPRLSSLATTFDLIPLAAVLLVGCLVLLHVVEARFDGQTQHIAKAPISGEGGFSLVLHDRYLLLIGLVLLVLNVVNTTGEYILSNVVRDHAMSVFPDLGNAAVEEQRREWIKSFYADFYSWVNVIAFLMQAFLVSRVIDKLGIQRSLFVLPLVVLGAYGAIAVFGGLALTRAAKFTENSTNYSLQNTLRQALFLPVSRAAKYKAKAAIDTFFVRAGDTVSAIVVGVAIHELSLGRRSLALVNVALVAVWIPICIGIARRNRALSTPAVGPVDV